MLETLTQANATFCNVQLIILMIKLVPYLENKFFSQFTAAVCRGKLSQRMAHAHKSRQIINSAKAYLLYLAMMMW